MAQRLDARSGALPAEESLQLMDGGYREMAAGA